MSARFIQQGHAIDYTPTVDVAAGEVIRVGNIFGVAIRPIQANQLGSLAVGGVYEIPKITGGSQAIAYGAIVYYDTVAKHIRKTDNTNSERFGFSVQEAANNDEFIRVLLVNA